jgi:hypothetical protein
MSLHVVHALQDRQVHRASIEGNDSCNPAHG